MKKLFFCIIILFSFSILSAQNSSDDKSSKKDLKKEVKKEVKKKEKKKLSLKEHMANLSADKDEKLIIAACDFVGKEEEADAISKLVSLLSDKRDNVRLHAVMALGYIGEEKGVDSINKVMLNDENSDVRYAALLSSVRIGSKKSIDSWKALKQKESDPFILDFLKKMEKKATGK